MNPPIQFRFFLLSISLVLFACRPSIEMLEDISYDYYPIEEGKYRIYQVDSIVYNAFICQTLTNSYQIKEVTGNVIIDGEGEKAYAVKRYKRLNGNAPWKLEEVWTEKIQQQQLQRIENNQRWVKMVFPIQEQQMWDGLSYIKSDTSFEISGSSIQIYKDWGDFEYQKTGSSFVDTSQTVPAIYPDVVEVAQADAENQIEKRYAKEVYAKNIGLVYRELWILDCQAAGCGACQYNTPWKERARKGYILVESLIEHNY